MKLYYILINKPADKPLNIIDSYKLMYKLFMSRISHTQLLNHHV